MTRPPYRGATLLDSTVVDLQADLQALQEIVSGDNPADLNQQVSALTDVVTGMADQLDAVSSEVDAVSGHLDALQAQFDSTPSATDVTSGLSSQISALNDAVSGNSDRLDQVSSSVDALSGDVQDLQTKTVELFHRKGEWDASTGSYPLTPKEGDTYRVTVAGAPIHDYSLYLSGWQGTNVPLLTTPRTNYFWPSAATSRRSITNLAQTTFTSGGFTDPMGGTSASRVVAAQDGVTGFGPNWLATTQTDLPAGAAYVFKLAMRAVVNPLQVTFKHSSDAASAQIVSLTTAWQVFTCAAFYDGTGSLSAYVRDTVNTGEGFDFAFVGAYDVDGTYIATVGAPVTQADYTISSYGNVVLAMAPAMGDVVNATAPADGIATPTQAFVGDGVTSSFVLSMNYYEEGEAIVYTGTKWDYLVSFQGIDQRLTAVENDVSSLQDATSGYASATDVAAVSSRVDTVSGTAEGLKSSKLDLGKGGYDYMVSNPVYYNATAGQDCNNIPAGIKALVAQENANTPGNTNTFWYIETLNTFDGSTFLQRASGYQDGSTWTRVYTAGAWTAWAQAGGNAVDLSGYAELAGADFTGAVSATMISSSGVTSSGEVVVVNPNALRMVNGQYGAFWRQDGVSLFLLLTNSGDQYGSWNALRPFVVDLAGGGVAINNGLTVNSISSTDGSITLRNKALTVDGAGNLAFNMSVLYSSAAFSLSAAGNYWNYNADGSLVTPGKITLPNGSGMFSVAGASITTGPAGGTWSIQRAGSTSSYFTLNDETGAAHWTWDSSGTLTTTHNMTVGDITCNGINFGSVVAASATDLSKHIALYGGSYGFAITGNTINYVAGGGQHNFIDSTGAGATVTAGVVVGSTRIYCGYDSGVTGSVSCSQWFRSNGNTGWYNATYGGGWFMQDATYVRSYQNKAVVASDFVISSDRRLKAGIKPLEFRGRLEPKWYVYRSNGYGDFGFIAQDVQELYPEAVGTSPGDGMLQLSYSKLTAVLAAQINMVEDLVIVHDQRLDKLEIASREHVRRITRNSRRITLLESDRRRHRAELDRHKEEIAALNALVMELLSCKPWWRRLWTRRTK